MHRNRFVFQTSPMLAMKYPKRSTEGFTLIELMVTLAIAAVLLVVGVPSFVSFQRNSQLTSLTNSLVASMYAARGEAMKTGMNAFVVPTGNGADWTTGWIVFVDKDRDGSFTESTDTIVQTQAAPESYFTVSGNGTAGETPAYVMFDSSGYSKTKTAGFGALTLSLTRTDVSSSVQTEETRRIIIAATGRLRTCKPSTDSTCTASASE